MCSISSICNLKNGVWADFISSICNLKEQCFELTKSVLSATSKRCLLTSSVIYNLKAVFWAAHQLVSFALWFSLSITQKVPSIPFSYLPQSSEYVLLIQRFITISSHPTITQNLFASKLLKSSCCPKSWHQLWENHAPSGEKFTATINVDNIYGRNFSEASINFSPDFATCRLRITTRMILWPRTCIFLCHSIAGCFFTVRWPPQQRFYSLQRYLTDHAIT